MGDYSTSRFAFIQRGITLNTLKEEMHALNMQMLLAMQNHDPSAQEVIGKQTAAVQEKIDRMKLGR